MKVRNISMPVKKSYTPRSTKPKSAKKGDDFSETYLDIVPFEGDLPPVGNIVLERFPPLSTHTRSNKRPTAGKSRPTAPQPSIDAPPTSTITERRVCYL